MASDNQQQKQPTARIVTDTREQRPYDFRNAIRTALPAGDYSIEGYESRVAIERKSLDDFIGTVLRSRERFAREIDMLRNYEFAAVVIESTPQDITGGNYKSMIAPSALLGIITGAMVRFQPVHVVLAGDRPHAKRITESLLVFAAQRCRENDALRALVEGQSDGE